MFEKFCYSGNFTISSSMKYMHSKNRSSNLSTSYLSIVPQSHIVKGAPNKNLQAEENSSPRHV